MHQEHQYLNLLRHVLDSGVESTDRTGTGTKRIFGAQMRFDLSKEFPLITTKKVHWKSVVGELLWFLSGSTNNNDLVEKYGVTIWKEWAKPNGDLGPVYGAQWRSWKAHDGGTIDQIAGVISEIKNNPNSRRLIVTAWNPSEILAASLPPCHTLFQFGVIDGKLNCHLFQRSADLFLGVPFNIASYSLLTQMIAHVTDLKAGEFVHSITDAHVYLNHVDQIRVQLEREPMPLPTVRLSCMASNIDDFKTTDIFLRDYKSHPSIKAPVAV